MVDRLITHVGEIPLDTDHLLAGRAALTAIGVGMAGLYGDGVTAAAGFDCAPGSGMTVTLATGMVVAPGPLDAAAYGTLGTSATVIKHQYCAIGPITLATPAGSTWLIYATLETQDTSTTGAVLPYYNAANPSQTFSGSANNGAVEPNLRQDIALLAAGTTLPSGAVPLWQVVVPAGATAITPSMITLASNTALQPTIPQLAACIVGTLDVDGAASQDTQISGAVPTNARGARILLQAAGGKGGDGNTSGAGGGASAGGAVEVVLPVLAGQPWSVTLGYQGVLTNGAVPGTSTMTIAACTLSATGGDGGALGGSTVEPGSTNFGTGQATGIAAPGQPFAAACTNGQSGQNGVISGSLLLGGGGGDSRSAPGGKQNVAVATGANTENQPGNAGYRGSGGSGGTGTGLGGFGGGAYLRIEWLA